MFRWYRKASASSGIVRVSPLSIMSYTRNGGHINPPLYHDYQELKDKHGERIAKMLIRFRLAHMQELMNVSVAEDILLESQCREVENFDVHMSKNSFAEAKRHLETWKTDMPEESSNYFAEEGQQAIQVRFFQTHRMPRH